MQSNGVKPIHQTIYFSQQTFKHEYEQLPFLVSVLIYCVLDHKEITNFYKNKIRFKLNDFPFLLECK